MKNIAVNNKVMMSLKCFVLLHINTFDHLSIIENNTDHLCRLKKIFSFNYYLMKYCEV